MTEIEPILDAFKEIRLRHNIFVHNCLWKDEIEKILKCLVQQAIRGEIKIQQYARNLKSLNTSLFIKNIYNDAGTLDHCEIIRITETALIYIPLYDPYVDVVNGEYDYMYYNDCTMSNENVKKILSDEEKCFLILNGVYL